MAKKLTEDAVRDKARDILGFKDKDGVSSRENVRYEKISTQYGVENRIVYGRTASGRSVF